MKLLLIGMLSVAILAGGTSCQHPAPSLKASDLQAERATGTYMGRYLGGTETLNLHAGGSYSHRIIRAGKEILNQSGSWEVAEGRLTLKSYVITQPDGTLSGPMWFSTPDDTSKGFISIDEDRSYFLDRQ